MTTPALATASLDPQATVAGMQTRATEPENEVAVPGSAPSLTDTGEAEERMLCVTVPNESARPKSDRTEENIG